MRYIAVADAGSSGSRIQIYGYDPAGKGGLVAVQQADDWHYKVEPGISSLAGQSRTSLDAYLAPLVDFVKKVVPSDQLADTPFFLLATAGMRLVEEQEQARILRETCRYVRSHGLKVSSCSSDIRVISGEEEGLFGWVAVNYLMNGFDRHGSPDEIPSTYGFLDMGGASMQIAFEPSPTEREKHAENLMHVELTLRDGRTIDHPVFVTTWLGFGSSEARRRYLDLLVRYHIRSEDAASTSDNGAPALVDDPCLPRGLELSDPKHHGYRFRGTGRFNRCLALTYPLLNKEVACDDFPCLFNGVHVPEIDFNMNRFVGISEYWYSTHDVWDMGGAYSYEAFESHAKQYCQQQWSDMEAAFSGVDLGHPERLSLQCFKAAWIMNILHEGIGVPRIIDENHHFQSVNQINDTDISWTLGKAILELNGGRIREPELKPPPAAVPIVSDISQIDAHLVKDVLDGSDRLDGPFGAGFGLHRPAWARPALSPFTAAAAVFVFIVLACLLCVRHRGRRWAFVLPFSRNGSYSVLSVHDELILPVVRSVQSSSPRRPKFSNFFALPPPLKHWLARSNPYTRLRGNGSDTLLPLSSIGGSHRAGLRTATVLTESPQTSPALFSNFPHSAPLTPGGLYPTPRPPVRHTLARARSSPFLKVSPQSMASSAPLTTDPSPLAYQQQQTPSPPYQQNSALHVKRSVSSTMLGAESPDGNYTDTPASIRSGASGSTSLFDLSRLGMTSVTSTSSGLNSMAQLRPRSANNSQVDLSKLR